MILRLGTSTGLAFVTTFALLLLMQFMLSSGELVLKPAMTPQFVNWLEMKEDTPTNTAKRDIKRPEPLEQTPQTPRPQTDMQPLETNIAVASPVAPEPSGDFSLYKADQDIAVIMLVQPVYPESALTRNLSGWVIVEYTVTVTGGVSDIVVVDSSSRLFNKAAITAASRFKYHPRVVNGNPVPVQGVRYRMTFQIDD